MSLPYPITISTNADLIAQQLEAWATPRKGEVKVVQSMAHLWEEVLALASQPDAAPRLLVVYNGEIPRGPFAQANRLHRVDRQWLVIVMRGHGFRNVLAEDGDRKEEPFYDCLEGIRDALRRAINLSEEFPIDYKGMKPLPNLAPGRMANAFMDAYTIEFSTCADIPAVYKTAPDFDPETMRWQYIGSLLRYDKVNNIFQMQNHAGVWNNVTDTPEGLLFQTEP